MPSSSAFPRLQRHRRSPIARAGGAGRTLYLLTRPHRLGGIATPGWHGWKTANVLSDAAGNIVRMSRQDQSLDLDYAANNCLAQVAKADRIVGSYVYDANGLRAQKTTGSHARQFIYDDQARLLGDYTPGTQQKWEYLWQKTWVSVHWPLFWSALLGGSSLFMKMFLGLILGFLSFVACAQEYGINVLSSGVEVKGGRHLLKMQVWNCSNHDIEVPSGISHGRVIPWVSFSILAAGYAASR